MNLTISGSNDSSNISISFSALCMHNAAILIFMEARILMYKTGQRGTS
jgi:hypothetical protein